MNSSGGALKALRDKMQHLRCDVDTLSNELTDKTTECEHLKAERAKDEAEINDLIRKLRMKDEELDKCTDQLKAALTDGQIALQRADESERDSSSLRMKENIMDEKLENFELANRKLENDLTEAEKKLEEPLSQACVQFIVDRARRALENKTALDDDRIEQLERQFKERHAAANDTEQKYEEISSDSEERETTREKRRVLESRSVADEERIDCLEAQYKETKYIAEDAERKYDEASRRLIMLEQEVDRIEDKYNCADGQRKLQEEELTSYASNLKTLESKIEQFQNNEDYYEQTIAVLKQRASSAEQTVEQLTSELTKKNLETDKLETELQIELEKNASLQNEMSQLNADLLDM